MIFARAVRRFIQPRPVTLFEDQIQRVHTIPYLGATLDKRLTWLPHIDQDIKKNAQMVGMLVPLLNKKTVLIVRNGVQLHKQLIRLMMDYACPA